MAQDKIEIPSKSFAANSSKVYPYEMDRNMKVTGGNYAHEVIDRILRGPALQSFVINCHGSPAYLDIGSDGLHWDNLDLWDQAGRQPVLWSGGQEGRGVCCRLIQDTEAFGV